MCHSRHCTRLKRRTIVTRKCCPIRFFWRFLSQCVTINYTTGAYIYVECIFYRKRMLIYFRISNTISNIHHESMCKSIQRKKNLTCRRVGFEWIQKFPNKISTGSAVDDRKLLREESEPNRSLAIDQVYASGFDVDSFIFNEMGEIAMPQADWKAQSWYLTIDVIASIEMY